MIWCANKLGALGVLLSDAMEGALGDLSASAAALLLTLHYGRAETATELAAIAGVAQPTAVRVLDGLIRRGLIERRARSGRTAPLRLTRAGKTRTHALQAARLGVLERLLAVLPKSERGAFERMLDRVLAGATTSRAFARTTCRLCDHVVCDKSRCPIGARASELEQIGGEASC